LPLFLLMTAEGHDYAIDLPHLGKRKEEHLKIWVVELDGSAGRQPNSGFGKRVGNPRLQCLKVALWGKK
jgi:hypothetical protein